MDVIVVSSNSIERVKGFQQRVLDREWNLHLSHKDGPFPHIEQSPAGVVVFAEKDQKIAEWVANLEKHTRYLSIPLIAVANGSDRQAHDQLLAAGACAVFDSDVKDEVLLSELQSRCDVQPVYAEIRKNLLEPFIEGTTITLQEMAGVKVFVNSVYQKSNYKLFGDISAIIGLVAPGEGSMVLSFPEATANAIVRRVLAGIADHPDADMIRDCVGEVINVVAGQAKGILSNTKYHFSFSTPTVISGANHEIRHKPNMACMVIAFGSDVGAFALQLCLHL
jgi:chemotaxis protein CheX